jgi:hypothetical protein
VFAKKGTVELLLFCDFCLIDYWNFSMLAIGCLEQKFYDLVECVVQLEL